MISVRRIMWAAARYYGLTRADLVGRSRRRMQIMARRAICVIAHRYGHSISAIARVIDLDHTTVLHHCRATRSAAEDDAIAEITRVLAGFETSLCDVHWASVVSWVSDVSDCFDLTVTFRSLRQHGNVPAKVAALEADKAEPMTEQWWANNDARFRAAMEAAHARAADEA